VGLLDDLRIRLRRWLGVIELTKAHNQLTKSTRAKFTKLEEQMAISTDDVARLNAATSRIAARVQSLLDQVDSLGTGNDDQVRQAQQVADIQAASEQLRPVLEQLEALGADATNVVPAPTPEQVPVEPGPDVAPVENGGGDGTVVTDPAPTPGSPAGDIVTAPDATPANPDGDVVFDESGLAVGTQPVQTDQGTVTTLPSDGTTVGEGAGASQPGPSGDEANPTR
jgi:hypothetical protein